MDPDRGRGKALVRTTRPRAAGYARGVKTFARSVVIDAPRAWLFAVMQDYGRRLEWDEFLSRAELVGGATESAKGVRAWCVDRAGRGMETEYVSFDPPERVAVKMTHGHGLWMVGAFAGSWVYEERGPESTEVIFRYSLELRSRLLGRAGDRLLAMVFERDMGKRLASAKARLERMWAAERGR